MEKTLNLAFVRTLEGGLLPWLLINRKLAPTPKRSEDAKAVDTTRNAHQMITSYENFKI